MEVTDASVRRTIYLAIVRPHLGYSMQVWSPQSVQRRTAKLILSLPFRTTTYKERFSQLNELPLTYWHLKSLIAWFQSAYPFSRLNTDIYF